MKALKWTIAIITLLVITYLLGPSTTIEPLSKNLPEVPSNLMELNDFINQREANIPNLRPNNEARIIWYDSVPTVTEYSMVYLHGFSASQEEGAPIHTQLASTFGCNLYLPRIAGHGLVEEEAMLDLTAKEMMESAAEAIAIGKTIGKKVILIGTSTGGTYGLYLAENEPDISAILLYSPNIEIYDKNSALLPKPWGVHLARLVKGSKYNQWPLDSVSGNYWTNKYRLEVLAQLRAMVDATMTTETFKSVTQPVFLGYYYRNDTAQDNTVSVPAMLRMFDELGTPPDRKSKQAFANANHHVIGSYLTSGAVEEVYDATAKFLKDVVKMEPVKTDSMLIETLE